MELETEFWTKNQTVCQLCFENPDDLKRKATDFPIILSQFKEQRISGETDHEVCFASILERVGFKFLLKKRKNDHLKLLSFLTDGFYYIYQVNGSQQSLDFQTILIVKHQVLRVCSYELKHSNTNCFYLNDGWFLDNVIYIITWRMRERIKTLVALGQSIPSNIDKKMYEKCLEIKKILNSQTKTHPNMSLKIYNRFANRYSCHSFTNDYALHRIQGVYLYFLKNSFMETIKS